MSCKPIQLSIPLPCREDWDQMSPDGRGRFCANCQKTIIDFSNWTDTALYEFFSKNTGPVCGRFQNTQLNRNIKIPPQPKSRLYRLVIACGLTLIFTQLPDVHARVKPPIENIWHGKEEDTQDNPVGGIKGKVSDETGKPISRIYLLISKVSETVHVARQISTNLQGEFYVDQLDPGNYEIVSFDNHYYFKEVIVSVQESDTARLTITARKSETPLFDFSNMTMGIVAFDHFSKPKDTSARIKLEKLKTEGIDEKIIKPGTRNQE